MDGQRYKVGIVGYGHLGKFLVNYIMKSNDLELAFVWNRSAAALSDVDEKYKLGTLEEVKERTVNLIVEVAHPSITEEFGELFLQHADFMIGSPTALANQKLEDRLRNAATTHGLYIPAGALWGGEDILKMASRKTLQGLKVSMTKHPSSFKLLGELADKIKDVRSEKTILYEGSVRDLCPLAPNNVNTMASAAIAASNLGFDRVQGCLIADPGLPDAHIVEVEVWGPNDTTTGKGFHVKTVRYNPSTQGAVTGSATFGSFLSSMKRARNQGSGVHLC